jgi:hypothetical protein
MAKRFNRKQFDREFWLACEADDVMSVIRHGLRSDVWRDRLMSAHFEMVYGYAHYENDLSVARNSQAVGKVA